MTSRSSVSTRDIMEEAGYQVEEAGNADEAMDALGSDGFSIVLTDIEMPGSVDGIGLARSIQANWPYMHVIIMSGQRLPQPSELPGAAIMLTKPFTAERLIDALAEAVR